MLQLLRDHPPAVNAVGHDDLVRSFHPSRQTFALGRASTDALANQANVSQAAQSLHPNQAQVTGARTRKWIADARHPVPFHPAVLRAEPPAS
jgi:hypothetical protein